MSSVYPRSTYYICSNHIPAIKSHMIVPSAQHHYTPSIGAPRRMQIVINEHVYIYIYISINQFKGYTWESLLHRICIFFTAFVCIKRTFKKTSKKTSKKRRQGRISGRLFLWKFYIQKSLTQSMLLPHSYTPKNTYRKTTEIMYSGVRS